MIITRQKDIADIIGSMQGKDSVFILGCELCATVCRTGGEDQLREMEETLRENGKKVTGWFVAEPACSLIRIRRLYREKKKEIDAADVILGLVCGGGVQAAAEVIGDKEVLPGNDTLFQGEITKLSPRDAQFDQKCSLCGECILASTGGVCAATRCPKGLINAPCGGAKNGKCEIDKELDCVWGVIYERLKKFGRTEAMTGIRPPRDHSLTRNPRSLAIESG